MSPWPGTITIPGILGELFYFRCRKPKPGSKWKNGEMNREVLATVYRRGRSIPFIRSSGQIDAVRNFPSRQPEQGKIIMATSTTVRRPISIPSVRSISEVPRRRIKCGGSSAYSFRGTPWYRVKFCNLHHPLEAWMKYKARVPKMQHEEIFWLLLHPWLLSECSWK